MSVLFTKPSKWRSLLLCDTGTSVIELAVAAPVLFMFIIGVTDLAGGFTERHRLQQAVNRTLEMAQTGRDIDYAYLADEAAAAAGVPKEQVVHEQWVECAGSADKKPWADDCPSGAPARFVKITITGSYTPIFGVTGFLKREADGKVKLIAHASLRVR